METTNKNEMESGFLIENLILMETSFKRISNVSFSGDDIKRNINVDVNVRVNGDAILVHESVDYTQTVNNIEEINCYIVMTGVFKKVGESNLSDLERFGHIN